MSPDRKARVLNHLKNGVHLSDILKREGLDTWNDRPKIRAVAKEAGLTVIDNVQDVDKLPLVFGVNSSQMARAGHILKRMHELAPPSKLCHVIGMNTADQRKARTGKHDWTMSQLSRMAEALGLQLSEVLQYMLETNPAKEMQWNQSRLHLLTLKKG
jgi:hypothetical protein